MTSHKLMTAIAVALALAVVVLFFVVDNPFFSISSFMTGTSSDAATAPSTTATNSGTQPPTQLVVQDEAIGSGATAQVGDMLNVSYTGKLENGTVFDTSVGKPAAPNCPSGTKEGFCFTLGAGQVIPGWDQGLEGMKVGGKRLLIIPAALAYGAQGQGSIPANATLIFEVELLGDSPAGGAQSQ